MLLSVRHSHQSAAWRCLLCRFTASALTLLWATMEYAPWPKTLYQTSAAALLGARPAPPKP